MQIKSVLSAGAVGLVIAIIFLQPNAHAQGGSAQNIERDARAMEDANQRRLRRLSRRPFSAGREVRSIDGSGNNPERPFAGASFQRFQRMMYSDYADGISSMAGPARKSAREISNLVAAQDGRSLPNDFRTSDFLWQWGQFLDHDIDLGDGVRDPGPNGRDFDIAVPNGDRYFDPDHTGNQVIHFDRALSDPASGDSVFNPREQVNEITSWIDGSMIYGSNKERAKALRTLDGTGRLKTSEGDLLPFNVDRLPNANGPAPDPTALFLAGDVRANEQAGLTAIHIVFAREHNRWAAIVKRNKPHYNDEEIYQAARRMVIAEIQIITYEEFLPALIGKRALPRYRGYSPGDATIFNEFAGAAYRFGHSAINTKLLRFDRRGRAISDGHLPLRSAFFNAPQIYRARDDIDPVLRGLAAQKSQAIDPLIVDDLRNFLFGPPGAGGFDLAALNIQRGRDLGLPSYNDAREAMGMTRVSAFNEISTDPIIQQALSNAYGTVDEIDLWVGGLAEDPVWKEDSQLGPLFRDVLARQFTALRDHDRFWHERDLTRAEYRLVRRVRLSDVIRANTNIGAELPRDVFYAKRRRGFGKLSRR